MRFGASQKAKACPWNSLSLLGWGLLGREDETRPTAIWRYEMLFFTMSGYF